MTTPDTALTAELVGTFRRLLEYDDLDEGSDFFAAGGDSLLATRVLSAIARDHGVELTFDDFAMDPTPEGLARRIAEASELAVAP